MKTSFPAKALAAVVVAAVLYAVLNHFNLVPAAIKQASSTPQQFALATEAPVTASTPTSAVALSLPTSTPAPRKNPFAVYTIPWNADMGLMFANGGTWTTKNSLMDKHGLSVNIVRQNDQNKSLELQVKFADAVAHGVDTPTDSNGVPLPAFVIIMGDGTHQYRAAADAFLSKLGPDYRAEVVGAVGYSRGEDCLMGPSSWKDSPEASKGGLIAGVILDGDWNVAMYWAANNNIKNNPDKTTYDPDALNWVGVDDFTKAGELYIQGYCEDRPVVRNGKLTNESKRHVCVDGAVTWTPGDVEIAKKKGGLVKILSTKENRYQMPATVVGIHQWDVRHSKQVEEFLAAAFEGAEQVKQHDEALQAGAKASYQVYGEQTPGYWARYYRGVNEPDKAGNSVPLGGSAAAGLADNLVLFGLADGSGGLDNSLFKATYEGFGAIAHQQYPKLVPAVPPTKDIVNTSFLQSLASKTAVNVANADLPTFASGAIEKSDVVATRNWTIEFESGKATFTPDAMVTLGQLYQVLLAGQGMGADIVGHTDNTGNPANNVTLSELRAGAVANYLQAKAPVLFPAGRLHTSGKGQDAPIASNATVEGRAKNRRVEIVLGTK